MPEFTLKQLIKELRPLGFSVEETKKGHFIVKYGETPVTGFAETHGSRTKRGMVRAPYVYKVRKECQKWLEEHENEA